MLMFSRKDVEMGFTGDPQVLQNIVTKAQLLHSGNKEAADRMRTIVILPGGGQRGVVQMGFALALEKLDLTDGIDEVIGVSSGAGVASYWLSGQAALGARVSTEELVKNHFVSYTHPLRIMNIAVLENILRKLWPLNLKKLKEQRTKLIIGVTDYKTGKEEFIDLKKLKDPIKGIIASVSIPVFAKNVVEIERHVYIDGGPGSPLPITYAIEELKPTDILVIQTRTLDYKPSFPKPVGWFLRQTAYRTLPKGVRDDLINYDERYNSEMEYIMGDKVVPKNVRLATIYPKILPIRKTCKNAKLLQKVLFSAEEFALKLFQGINK